LADCYLDYYNGKEAIKTMYRVLDLYPERIPSLLKLSELHYIMEDYDSSILAVNEAFKVDPQNAECFFMLGVNFRALNDIERAINSFQSAVELDSGLTDAWIMLGELYENKKDPKALKYYENAVLSAPNSIEAKHAKAFYLQNNGNIPLALDLYNEIILQDKYYENAYQNSGILYVELDSFDRAYDQFNIMTGINPQNHMGFYLRGTVLKIKGDLSAAKLDFESALNLKAEDPIIIEALKEVEEMLNKK
jgi:tetratricopeptide (TPR) repeat protein